MRTITEKEVVNIVEGLLLSGNIAPFTSIPQIHIISIDRDGYIKIQGLWENEFESIVGDHHVWYYMAKDNGVTHWWHE